MPVLALAQSQALQNNTESLSTVTVHFSQKSRSHLLHRSESKLSFIRENDGESNNELIISKSSRQYTSTSFENTQPSLSQKNESRYVPTSQEDDFSNRRSKIHNIYLVPSSTNLFTYFKFCTIISLQKCQSHLFSKQIQQLTLNRILLRIYLFKYRNGICTSLASSIFGTC